MERLVPIGTAVATVDAQIIGKGRLLRRSASAKDLSESLIDLVNRANLNSQTAGVRTSTMAKVFGREVLLFHEGKLCQITFWKRKPYLLSTTSVPG